jgi:hypothetical protein
VGFVAVVPLVLNENTDLNKLIEHYRGEALSGIGQPSERAGLVLGINSRSSVWNSDLYESKVSEIRHDPESMPVSVVPFTWDAAPDKNGKIGVPYGTIRGFITNHAETQSLATLLKQRGMARIYIHLGDSDVHSLRIGPADRADATQERPGLFGAAAEVLQGNDPPEVLSGGYRAPDSEPLLVKMAVDADMPARQGLSRAGVRVDQGGNRVVGAAEKVELSDIRPGLPIDDWKAGENREKIPGHSNPGRLGYGPYLPEPNTFVRYREGRDLDFGQGANETRNMVTALGGPKIAFDQRLAIATDMGRLGERLKSESRVNAVTRNLGNLRKIYNKHVWKKIPAEADAGKVDDQEIVTLFSRPEAKEDLNKLRTALREILQTHVQFPPLPDGRPRTGMARKNFEKSLDQVGREDDNRDRREADEAGQVASTVAIEHSVAALLRQALPWWRRNKDFDPLR